MMRPALELAGEFLPGDPESLQTINTNRLWSVAGNFRSVAGKQEIGMLVGFIMLYVELAGLFIAGGYAISSLFVGNVIPESFSPEQALLISMQ